MVPGLCPLISPKSMFTILVVDDKETILDIITGFLEDKYSVIAVTTAMDALDVINRGGVDLLITDLGLDIMSGWDLIERVREKHGDRIKILAMSAGGPALEYAMKLGADDYFLKAHSSMDMLLEKVSRLLTV